MEEKANDISADDVITILIATDNHLGYMERDPLRSNDSFQTFEEILLYAKQYNVDMMLLGGDLFHDNKPSRKTLYNTIALLRKHCMGDKPCQLEFLSDQKRNFTSFFPIVNYEDPNLNISLPIFSIHGNHDDPSGDGNLCALDILSASGLVNYFGKSNQVDNIEISPILLKKGDTRLALYGLGNIRDERLYRTFLRKNVKMLRPRQNMDDWFNLFVLHQNRVSHNPKNYIPETFLNDFIDLILWGHEHECLIDLSKNEIKNFYITQPGSSIATSLCEGESKTKHIGILRIKQKQFEIEKIKLKSVRPFLMMDICLQDDLNDERDPTTVTNYLIQKVDELEKRAIDEWKENNPELSDKMNCPRPLIRLRVEYSGGYPTFNPHKFGQKFVNRIANPNDILHFYRKKSVVKPNSSTENDITFLPEKLESTKIETLIDEFLQIKNLDILNEKELGNAVKTYIEKDEKDAIKEYVDKYLNDICKEVKEKYNTTDVNLLNEQIKTIKNIKKEKYNSMDNSLNIFSNFNNTNLNKEDEIEMDNNEQENKRTTKTKKQTGTKKRIKKNSIKYDEEEEEEKEEKEEEKEEDDDDDDLFKINEDNDVIEIVDKPEKINIRKNGRKTNIKRNKEKEQVLLNDTDEEKSEKNGTKKQGRKKNVRKDNENDNETNKKIEKTTPKRRGKKKGIKIYDNENNENDIVDILSMETTGDKIFINENSIMQMEDEIESSESSRSSNNKNKIKKETKRGTKRKLETMQSVNLDDHSTAVFDSNITHIDINNTINTEANTSSTRRTRKLPSIFGLSSQSAPKRTRISRKTNTKELHQSQLDFSIKPKK
jgi:double-strand break repair protein MRE11